VLVAWNVTLESNDLDLARHIAATVRASSGGLPAVRALGWTMPEYGRVQVSTNLLDWRKTSPWVLTEAVRREAGRFGVGVAGAELIGLAPEAALLRDAPHAGLARPARLKRLVKDLGLDHLGAFDLDARLLERRLPSLRRPLD
jgi:glutamate formiminotransferase